MCGESAKAYLSLVLEYHAARGRPDGDELIESLEARMTLLWDTLDSYTREFVNGACSDIQWANRGGFIPQRGRKREEVTPEEMDRFQAALDAKDPGLILARLRLCQAACNNSQVAKWRLDAYTALGMTQVAEAFRRLAGVADVARV